uniref:Uncharacterized protein n=1 Tax=Zea mays TaxID=4577 RepID=A0A804PMS4_MAIZE
MARQLVKVLGRQPLRALLVLPRRRCAEDDAPPERPDDDEDVEHQHRHDAGDQEEHGHRQFHHCCKYMQPTLRATDLSRRLATATGNRQQQAIEHERFAEEAGLMNRRIRKWL